MGNCHFKTDFDAENITGKLSKNFTQYLHVASIGGSKRFPSVKMENQNWLNMNLAPAFNFSLLIFILVGQD